MLHLKIAILLIATFATDCQCIEQKESEKPLIDYLTLDYLSVEQNLWRRINNRNNDKTELYSIIRNEHQRFISSDFGAVASQQNPSITIQLVNSLFYNASVLLNSENLALDDIIYLFRTKILDRALRYSDDVFHDASRADFWEKGKNVRIFNLATTKTTTIILKKHFHFHSFRAYNNADNPNCR